MVAFPLAETVTSPHFLLISLHVHLSLLLSLFFFDITRQSTAHRQQNSTEQSKRAEKSSRQGNEAAMHNGS
jgi:hypothetical protein